ncbi:MAG: ATP-binding protein [Acidobacteriota bacterium]|nr:ATP-binding protein [Acidobacteriota bacterium]
MTSPLFVKLSLAALLLIAATLFAVDYALLAYAQRERAEELQTQLRAEAALLVHELRTVPEPDRDAWIRSASNRTNAQVSLTAADGTLLAGPSRVSDEGGMQSASAGVSIGGRWAVLKLSAPPPTLDALTETVRAEVIAISLGAAIFALLVAYLVSRSLSSRIRRLKNYAGNLLDKDESDHPAGGFDAPDELGSLERSLGAMAVQLRQLVDRLELESARREAILSSMAEGVLAVDDTLHVTFCNESFLRLAGVNRSSAEGLPILELVRDPGLFDVLSRVVRSGESIKEHLQVRPASGRSFELQAAPLETGAGRGALAVLHDTTDLERLEQVRKDFVANVSHELRTPLAAIAGYAETLLDGALEDERHNRKFVEIIQSHAIRLNSIASDLLVLSELEAGINPGELGSVSVRDAIENALATVESEARMRGVNLIREQIENAYVMGNQIRLEQALLNLLTNAVKFNRPGGEVRVGAGSVAEGGVFIRISDTGVGIPFENLPRIFERFYRVDKARSRQVGGTGLGLSIVKHIIERMEGKIAVESQLGKGAAFTVLLRAGNSPASRDLAFSDSTMSVD